MRKPEYYTYELGKIVSGNSILQKVKAFPKECQVMCDRNVDCKGFVYDRNGFCDFKKSVDTSASQLGNVLYIK